MHAIMMLQEKIMKESSKDRRDTFEEERASPVFPGTLPVTEGTKLEREGSPRREQGANRPYPCASSTSGERRLKFWISISSPHLSLVSLIMWSLT